MGSNRNGPKLTSSSANTETPQALEQQQAEPLEQAIAPTYPIEEAIGPIPEVGEFKDFSHIQQIAIATTTANQDGDNTLEKLSLVATDYQTMAFNNPGTGFGGQAQSNQDFIRKYTSSGAHALSAQAFESWQAYTNWILGVKDVRSSWVLRGETIYQAWDQNTALDWSYAWWYLYKKSSDFNAVAP